MIVVVSRNAILVENLHVRNGAQDLIDVFGRKQRKRITQQPLLPLPPPKHRHIHQR